MKTVDDYTSLYIDFLRTLTVTDTGARSNFSGAYLDNYNVFHIWKVANNFTSVSNPIISHYGCDLVNQPYLINSQALSLPSSQPAYSLGACLLNTDQNYFALPHADGNGGVVLIDSDFNIKVLYAGISGYGGAVRCCIYKGYAYYICRSWPAGISLTRSNIASGTSINIPFPFTPKDDYPYAIGVLNNQLIVIVLDNSNNEWLIQYDLFSLAYINHALRASYYNNVSLFNDINDNKLFFKGSANYLKHIESIGGAEIQDSTIVTTAPDTRISPFNITINNLGLYVIFFATGDNNYLLDVFQKAGSPCSTLPLDSINLNSLLQNYYFFIAELYTITLASGAVIRLTSGDGDLTYGCNLYEVGSVRIQRGDITTAIGVEVSDVEVTLLCNADSLINGVNPQQFAVNGGFDGASIKILLVPMPTYGDVSAGAIHLFEGIVTDCKPDLAQVVLTVSSDLILLNAMTPKNVYQPTCLHTLYDTQCAVNKASFTVSSSVLTGSTTTQLLCGLAQASAYFELGTLLFTSGANAGTTRTVRSYTPGIINLSYPLEHSPAISDTFTISAGCDKLRAGKCRTLFNNEVNFLGFEYMPVPEASS